MEGGADAIFLGLKQFNARGRAVNFSNPQLITMLDIAGKNKKGLNMMWLPSVCAAASVLLKYWCKHLNAFQLLVNSILQHSSLTVCKIINPA